MKTIEQKALHKINKLLKCLQISVKFADDIETVQYRPIKGGKAIIELEFPLYKDYILKNNNRIDKNIIVKLAHEIGHYLVSPPKRRRQLDFGIRRNNVKRSKSVAYKYDLEEVKAQAIEFEILERLKVKHLNRGPDFRKRLQEEFDVSGWWKTEGKQLVNNMFYILG